MRAKEFVVEGEKFHQDHLSAIPGMQMLPGLDNSNPYHMWRFIVASGALDGKGNGNKLELDGPIGQKLNTVTYSKEDGDIVKATAKSLGLKVDEVSSQASDEPNDTNKTSPIKGFKGYKR
jgi:hypothetical protein